MAAPNDRLSTAMARTGQWVFSQEIPSDLLVQVGDSSFSLHKFMLVAKSNYIRQLIVESKEADVTTIDVSDIPGGAETFEKAAKFCYGVNFEITVNNVAALRCASEYLQMTDSYCDSSLASRTEEFLAQVALSSFSGAVVVLKSCEDLLPLAEDLKIVQRCVNVISIKICNEANFPSRSPANWWTEELSILDVKFLGKITSAMKQRGAKAPTIASAIITYTERNLRDLVRDHSGNTIKLIDFKDFDIRTHQREVLQDVISILPSDKAAFSINFLCCLLRAAIFLKASASSKTELEKRISSILEQATTDDLLIVSTTYDGERLCDLDSVRKIISGFVEKEKSTAVFGGADFKDSCSPAIQRVVKTVDSYLAEIATHEQLSISKFNGIAILIPKAARKIDDDLYRAIDIYLKAHPNLDEIEREKVCSVMDPLKLSYEARLHASQNKRLPVQMVLHALYFDQLMIRSGALDETPTTPQIPPLPTAAANKKTSTLHTDVSLIRENEALRSELTKMKLFINDIQKTNHNTPGTSSATKTGKKNRLFSSVSKSLAKLNPFRSGSKDTSQIDDLDGVDLTKPRRRRFSVS
ncbi:root phototropism protein 2 [Euphorbia lathyris]|uniref:root phototropism protein 2 n=1 Tax=Euphorbia lathyris TaxID=212925 RepID=UPI003313431A